jgi:glycosyltransferase involved in cell wall biosynthesis
MMPYPSGRHLLMTADAVGGVWSHATSLAQELARRGWAITLVTLGPAPRQDQFVPLLSYPRIELEITDLALEWQDPEGDDRERVLEFLGALEERVRPDVVHLNGYREACANWRAPVLVTAHSCVGSWWRACRGSAPCAAGWQAYLADVAAGLKAADRWVAPTVAFRDMVGQLYAPPRKGEVIWNGLAGIETAAASGAAKEPFILAAGRLWDESKNIGVLPGIAGRLDWPVRIAGARRREGCAAGVEDGVEWFGRLPNAELLAMMRRAGIFVSPAVYEPFGLTVLEAASSGCALVLADIPAFRELWDEAALFVDPRDAEAILAALNGLARDAGQRAELQAAARERAGRYTLAAKADAYERLYREMLGPPSRRSPRLSASDREACAVCG